MHAPLLSASAGAALSALAVFTALSICVVPAQAQRKERQGKEVVDATCAACHLSGKDNAPRIGDARAWSARASQGLTGLTEHALKGIRSMPAHGGNADVSDIEIERAITYMVNASGGHWIEPVGGATPAVVRTGESIVRMQCAKCHRSGVDGAPRIGDQAAWIPRLKRGLDSLVASAVHGHGPMPSRGGLPDLSDVEIRAAIVSMFDQGLPPMPAQTPVAAADPRHKAVSGMDIYLGTMRAESLRAASGGKWPGSSLEVPAGKGYYHVNISLVDSTTHVPVTDAEVRVRVSDGMTAESHVLELLAAGNSVSYGNFYRLSSGSAYDITAEIRRPGVSGAIRAKFDFKAP